MRNILPIAGVVTFVAVSSLGAQLATPGPSGVVMGHLHLTAKDAAVSRTFWSAVGGVAVQNGSLQLIQFPGTFVMLRGGQPTAGTAGSTVDHVTFRVQSLRRIWDGLAKENAAGLAADGNTPGANKLITSDGIVVQLVADASLGSPMQMDSISIVTVAPDEAQAWYVKQFGATAGKSGAMPIATLPGVKLEFGKAETAPAGTRGRALDHIGFDVRNLEEFCKKLEANGIKLDRAFTRLPNSQTAIAFLTDPWGTYIELTENLAPAKSRQILSILRTLRSPRKAR